MIPGSVYNEFGITVQGAEAVTSKKPTTYLVGTMPPYEFVARTTISA